MNKNESRRRKRDKLNTQLSKMNIELKYSTLLI